MKKVVLFFIFFRVEGASKMFCISTKKPRTKYGVFMSGGLMTKPVPLDSSCISFGKTTST